VQTLLGRAEVRVEVIIVLLLIVVIVAVLARAFVSVVTFRDYQRGLHYRQGKLVGLLSTGTHVAIRPITEIQLLDARPTQLTVPGQEILTADGVALKISLTAQYVVADPVAALTNDQSWQAALYAALHAGLRDAIAGRTADDVLASRAEIGPTIAGSVASEIARIGVELLSVDVRDVMVPGELKRAFAGVVAARREGEAALERARGEQAALRSLANAGRLLEDNPGLLQLRVIQQLGSTPGNTIMLDIGGSDGRTPVAGRAIHATPGAAGGSVVGRSVGAGGSAVGPANASASEPAPPVGGVPGRPRPGSRPPAEG
jgi:regulator of protease activity HflC (stomatin/prohibitin superfamily)